MVYCLKAIDVSAFPPQRITQLIREIKVQSFTNHPNIVNLYQFFVAPPVVYLLLEPCLGSTLFQDMRNQSRFNEKKARKQLQEVTKAIEYLHKLDIIHRDIKPENILLHEVLMVRGRTLRSCVTSGGQSTPP